MSDTPAEFGLIVPFIVCATNGGPYDDGPYCAGYEAGTIAVVLASLPPEITQAERTVRTDNLPQIDLIAMQHGWTVNAATTEWPEWTTVAFKRETSP